MQLIELDPHFLKILDDKSYRYVDVSFSEADDLSLVAGSSSIMLGNGSNITSPDHNCNAHFLVTNGKIERLP